MQKQLNTYSFSKLKCFYSCKHYYYLHYFDNEGMIPESHGTSEFGSFMHKILELYGKGELDIYDMLPYYEKHYAENVTSTFTLQMTKTFSKDMGAKYYENGYEFLNNFTGFDFRILETEKRFEVPYQDKFLLNGQIDVIAEDDEGLMVIDYKSKGAWKSKAERLSYEKQLYFYAYALKKLYGEYPKKMAFFMFRLNKWTWVNFDENRLKEVLDWVEDTVNEIESEFDFTPVTQENGGEFDFYCNNFCDFRHQCPYGQINN